MEWTAFTIRSLNEAQVIEKYCFTIVLHTIQRTKPTNMYKATEMN